MEHAEHLLVLDAGGGGERCHIFTARGDLVASAYRPWEFFIPPDVPFGGSEFDPVLFWEILGQVSREALAGTAIDPSSIKGIGVTSFRDGFVLLDRQGAELYCGTNQDARGLVYAGQVAEMFPRLKEIAGRVSLGLDAAARLLWFRDNKPALLEKAGKLLMVSDWIVFRLTGEYSTDPSNASSSLLFDINSRDWSREIASALEVERLLPPCLNGGQVAGRLTDAAARHLGLPAGIPVSAGIGDSQAGTMACGCFEHGETAAIIGTTAPVQMVVQEPVADPSQRTWLGSHVLPGRWVLESNAGPAGSVYSWYCDHLSKVETEAARQTGKDLYQMVEQLAEEEAPGFILAFLGPWIADMSTLPLPVRHAILAPATGAAPSITGPRLARGIMENIAFALAGNLKQLEEITGLQVGELKACGGMTRSRLMVRILSAATGRPVVVPRVREACSLGAAITASLAGGVYSSLEAAAAEMIRLEEPCLDREAAEEYRELFQQWLELQEKLPELA